MAAPDQVVQAFGTSYGGSTDDLFLKVFSGEVMTAFNAEVVTPSRHVTRTITSGKSAQFPLLSTLSASYHTAGTYILGQASNTGEYTITVDALLICPLFLANIDEAKTHFDVRAPYTSECGVAIGQTFDQHVLQSLGLAARDATTPVNTTGGTTLTSATTLYKTSSTDLAAGLFLAAQTLAERNVPMSQPRSAFVRPAQYYLLAQNVNLINKDWGGSGAYSDASITKVAGIELVMTNNLPITNINTGLSKYQGDWSKMACLVTTPRAAGTLKLMDLAIESEYKMELQGTLIIARLAVGHAPLRGECAVELLTTS